jgi:hypothetical protein
MWGGIAILIIQACAGGVGANIAGEFLRRYTLGTVGNTITGIVGGGVGAQLMSALAGGTGTDPTGGGLDIGSIIAQAIFGGACGGALMVIIGLVQRERVGQRSGV